MAGNTVEFTPEAIKDYLDTCIRFWRNNEDEDMKAYYVDAFQSVRVSLFGEVLPSSEDLSNKPD